jgi:hypothetical protein
VAKKQKRKKIIAKRAQRSETEINPETGEDRRAEAVTVAWMLSMLAATGADLLSAGAYLVLPRLYAQAAQDPGMSPLVFPRLLLLIAAVTGAACVALTPAVYRFRNEPPPLQITIFGLVVSIGPVLALFWMTTQR